jgi:hypothetical protein
VKLLNYSSSKLAAAENQIFENFYITSARQQRTAITRYGIIGHK